MIPVRQSTAFECAIGPVLDADGVAVTGGVVGDFKIKKTTGNFAALNGSATLTHVSAGFYDLVLTTSDTDTVGLACIAIDDGANACPPLYLQVIEEAVYDGLFAASAGALATAAALATVDDFLDTEVAAILAAVDTEVGAIKTKTDFLPSATAGSAGGVFIAGSNAATTVNITGNVTGNVTGSVGSIASGGITAASLAADVQTRLGIVAYGTAQAATSTSLQLASASAFADDELIGAVLVITGGSAGVGQSRVITDNVMSTDTVTVDAWTTTPSGTITYVIFAAPPASATALPAVNIARINNVPITGDGSTTPFDV